MIKVLQLVCLAIATTAFGACDGSTYVSGLSSLEAELEGVGTSAPAPEPGEFNEPAGMTELLSFDGTTKDWDDQGRVSLWGQAYGDPAEGSTGPFTGRWEVADDPTNPIGTGKVLRQNWRVGDGSGHNGVIVSDLQIDGQNLDEIYIRYYVKYSANWQWHAGADKMQLYGVGNTSQQFIFQPRANGTIRWVNQVGSGNGDDAGVYVAVGENGDAMTWSGLDTWWLIEIHHKANSDNQTADGFLHVWVDGEKVAQWTKLGGGGTPNIDLADGNRLWTNNFGDPGFYGYKWYYWGGSGDTKTVNDHIDWGEFYVGGKVN